METTLSALELTGVIDSNQQLQFDEPLPFQTPKRVRVILLYAEDEDVNEQEWMQAASHNSAFDFLNDPAEDIYTLNDGQPLTDEI